MGESDVLRVKDVAAYLHLSEQSVREYLLRGEIPGRKVGKHWRISRYALEEWLHAPSGNRAGGGGVTEGGSLESFGAGIRDRGVRPARTRMDASA